MTIDVGHEIIRIRAAGIDVYGDPVGPDSSAPLCGCSIAPRSSDDIDARGRNGATDGLTLYCPQGTDITHTDRVSINGTVYRVTGEVADWRSPLSGRRPGVTVGLERGEG